MNGRGMKMPSERQHAQKKLKFIAGKLIRGLSLLIGLSVLAFVLVRTSPVDPVLASVDYD